MGVRLLVILRKRKEAYREEKLNRSRIGSAGILKSEVLAFNIIDVPGLQKLV